MKITLKLSADAIFAIDTAVSNFAAVKNSPTKDILVAVSVATDIKCKFSRKVNLILPTVRLQKKRFKITLKYHEAYALEHILRIYADLVENDYDRHLLIDVAGQLNQKMA